ncbi:hypothetical protein SVAN01_10270 [Stagonosporopsis vannaccii]|nr:hypothetical protein SVAN01_10270 [Stagonosporopsis vannaccii]
MEDSRLDCYGRVEDLSFALNLVCFSIEEKDEAYPVFLKLLPPVTDIRSFRKLQKLSLPQVALLGLLNGPDISEILYNPRSLADVLPRTLRKLSINHTNELIADFLVHSELVYCNHHNGRLPSAGDLPALVQPVVGVADAVRQNPGSGKLEFTDPAETVGESAPVRSVPADSAPVESASPIESVPFEIPNEKTLVQEAPKTTTPPSATLTPSAYAG